MLRERSTRAGTDEKIASCLPLQLTHPLRSPLSLVVVVVNLIMAALLSSSSPLLLRKFPKFPPLEKTSVFSSVSLLSLRSPPSLSILSSSSNAFIKSQAQELSSTTFSDPDVAVEEETEKNQHQIEQEDKRRRRKLYTENLPWTFSSTDLQNLFCQCGTVKDIEIIKHKNGKNRGFAFITMASAEEARAAIEKLDSMELEGRIIKVEYAKSLKKPSPPTSSVPMESRHKIYASNLSWNVRSSNLRELFMSNGNPLSVRVVFDSSSGRFLGYGFVSYATKEEAEAAVAALDGKELMGRPLRLRINETKLNDSGGGK